MQENLLVQVEKNLIINGDMRINQRGTSSHTINSTTILVVID